MEKPMEMTLPLLIGFWILMAVMTVYGAYFASQIYANLHGYESFRQLQEDGVKPLKKG